jgi:XTP/dITP diphosphohydrolase
MELIFASHNKNKMKEMQSLINLFSSGNKFTLLSLNDIGIYDKIKETGTTFVENARIKAEYAYSKTKRPCIADDSGICVDVLNGAPGVYSAEYAGLTASDAENNQKLIDTIKPYPFGERTARFMCTIYCILDDNNSFVVTGKTDDGLILDENIGENGFGYDSLFYFPPLAKTFAQITLEEKNKYSHRARAVKLFVEAFEKQERFL